MPTKRKIKKTTESEKKVSVTPPVTGPVKESTKTVDRKAMVLSFLRRPQIIILIILVILGFVFYYLRRWMVVAEVNGQPISRMEFSHLLEVQNGDQVLNELIAKTLILQEADKKHIAATPAEVNSRVQVFQKALTKQGQTLDQYLAFNKKSKQDFNDEVRVQIILEKLLAKDIAVTDKEVSDYIDQNKDTIPASVNPTDLKAQVKQQLTQQKLQQKLPPFIQNLQKKAQVNRLVNF